MYCEISRPHTSKNKYSKYIKVNVPLLHLDHFDTKAKSPGKNRKVHYITNVNSSNCFERVCFFHIIERTEMSDNVAKTWKLQLQKTLSGSHAVQGCI